MSAPLSNLPHLRVGWQKVCDRYNTTAYVAQLLGSAGLACYTNRSDAEAAGTIIETLAPAGTPDQKTRNSAGRKSGKRATQARKVGAELPTLRTKQSRLGNLETPVEAPVIGLAVVN